MATVYIIAYSNGKLTPGRTVKTAEERYKEHESGARNGSYLPKHRAMMKYGIENCRLIVLHTNVTYEESGDLEIWYISRFNTFMPDPGSNGYNLTRGGDGVLGSTWGHTDEWKTAVSKSLKATWADPDSVFNTEEYRKKMSEGRKAAHADPDSGFNTTEYHAERVTQLVDARKTAATSTAKAKRKATWARKTVAEMTTITAKRKATYAYDPQPRCKKCGLTIKRDGSPCKWCLKSPAEQVAIIHSPAAEAKRRATRARNRLIKENNG